MNSLLLDVSVAFRFFARRRAATAVIVLTMALALGANTAAFSVLRAFIFSSLGFPEPDRVVNVWTVREIDGRGPVNFLDAYVNVKLMRETTRFWRHLGISFVTDFNWQVDGGDARRLQGARADVEFFRALGVQPVLGRVFTPEELGPRAAPVVIIGERLWRTAFAGDPAVLQRSVRLDGAPHTIVGVLPEAFSQPFNTEVWTPLDMPPQMWTNIIGARQLAVFARLAPGVTPAAANEELRAFTARAIEAHPDNRNWSWTTQPRREAILNGADRALLFVQAGAAVLLILAITNLAALLLAWAAERQRETAVRLALGASAWRLARQFLIQSLLLVTAGGAAGALLAALTLPLLPRLAPNPAFNVFLTGLKLDSGALGFAAALVLGTGLVAGLLPAWQARRTSFQEALRSESRGASLSREGLRWQQAMVVVQAAVAVLILTGAGLAAVGFARLAQVPLGIRLEQRAAFQVQFPEPAYLAHEARARFVRDLEQNLAREPQLQAFGFTGSLPVGDGQWGGGFIPQRANGEFDRDPTVLHFRRVTPGYFAAMGMRLIEGRLLEERDTAAATPVAVISQSTAEKFWPGAPALGRKLRRGSQPNAPLVEVVGIVNNVRDAGAASPEADALYMPWDQVSMRRGWVVLAGAAPAELIAAGRRALAATAPDIAAYNPGALEDFAWQGTALPRLQMALLGVFAVIAIGITALGSYGVMSQLVANREKEMAIRAALGASRGDVLALVLWTNARLALLGTALGLAGAFLAARWARSALTGFPADVGWPYAAVVALVLVLTQLASWLPARRAAGLDAQKVLSGA